MQAVIELQRYHQKRLMTWPVPLRMALQIGVASGEVVEVEGDCFGDAVNLASRLERAWRGRARSGPPMQPLRSWARRLCGTATWGSSPFAGAARCRPSTASTGRRR